MIVIVYLACQRITKNLELGKRCSEVMLLTTDKTQTEAIMVTTIVPSRSMDKARSEGRPTEERGMQKPARRLDRTA